ncbi:MAG TPA: beta-propeller fold lactonase family protein [Candidatus Saccharimonadales bacterium]|nr:beta-propeller fold lactonase family protein [Candidatus Saccharimonadales bacterium]
MAQTRAVNTNHVRDARPVLATTINTNSPMRGKQAVLVAFALLICTIVLGAGSAQAGVRDDNDGAVFVMTNAADKNEIVAYDRAEDGSLRAVGSFATGGTGSGGTIDPLRSQGSLLLSGDHRFLFAVNAGSGTVSAFAVRGSNLRLLSVKSSGGSSPIALAQSGDLLYALNIGGNGNVSGFFIDDGRLRPIRNSNRNLSGTDTGASSLAFSPDRQHLVVTERTTNKIDVYRVSFDGTLSSAVVSPSSGAVPFAAKFAPNGALVIAEASNSISSYAVQPDQTLAVITPSLPSLGAATCWNVITPNGRYVYTSNAGTSSLSGFLIGRRGALSPIGATVVATNPTGSTNLDITVSADGKFIYTLNAGTGAIGIFSADRDGSVLSLGTVDGLPAAAGLNGIAAF